MYQLLWRMEVMWQRLPAAVSQAHREGRQSGGLTRHEE